MNTAFDVVSKAILAARQEGRAYSSDDAATYHVGAIFIKHIPLSRKGDSVVQHSHKHPHVTLIASGSVLLMLDGETEKVYTAPAFVEIASGKHHAFTALDPNTNAYCIHDTREIDLGEPFGG
jgi:hypothetical protein